MVQPQALEAHQPGSNLGSPFPGCVTQQVAQALWNLLSHLNNVDDGTVPA